MRESYPRIILVWVVVLVSASPQLLVLSAGSRPGSQQGFVSPQYGDPSQSSQFQGDRVTVTAEAVARSDPTNQDDRIYARSAADDSALVDAAVLGEPVKRIIAKTKDQEMLAEVRKTAGSFGYAYGYFTRDFRPIPSTLHDALVAHVFIGATPKPDTDIVAIYQTVWKKHEKYVTADKLEKFAKKHKVKVYFDTDTERSTMYALTDQLRERKVFNVTVLSESREIYPKAHVVQTIGEMAEDAAREILAYE